MYAPESLIHFYCNSWSMLSSKEHDIHNRQLIYGFAVTYGRNQFL